MQQSPASRNSTLGELMRFIDLYNVSVERYWTAQATREDGSANSFINVATDVAEDLVTTLEDSAELLADIVRNCPPPNLGELEASSWIEFVVFLFWNMAGERARTNDRITAEDDRRDRIEALQRGSRA